MDSSLDSMEISMATLIIVDNFLRVYFVCSLREFVCIGLELQIRFLGSRDYAGIYLRLSGDLSSSFSCTETVYLIWNLRYLMSFLVAWLKVVSPITVKIRVL